ncbi:MAG: orotidine-5'-phosphate decarboxylase [Alphaproteobacteria bacterium]|nr:orotidine-5'-phosphate decarboxylase [Alphaproteobacteria bacterium]MDA7988258.1 orotidine-5'-phosphate decarboxylase [Alphaproteobacteria bacterium]MDA8031787.1 orotidine-5'-phosphate decarboxylase [Alphaproteobacteria bacterium]
MRQQAEPIRENGAASSPGRGRIGNGVSPGRHENVSDGAGLREQIRERIYAAIDDTSEDRLEDLRSRLLPYVGGVKLGPAFLTGRDSGLVVDSFKGVQRFLDLKLHDIPNTVACSVRRLFCYRPRVITVHASGGYEMLRAATEAARDHEADTGIPRPMIIAVTVLTSLSAEDLAMVGQDSEVREQVLRLGDLALRAGLDGVVSAPRDVGALREEFGDDLKLFTPGIRPERDATDDHKRAMTPEEALSAGADYLVIGRPLTRARRPDEAAERLLTSLERFFQNGHAQGSSFPASRRVALRG